MSRLPQRIRSSPGDRAGVLAHAVIVKCALVVWLLPPRLAHGTCKTDAERLKAGNDVRATLRQALAGACLLLGLYFTARTLQVNRRTLELNTEGQITERFTKANDQLGNGSLDVRLGGIYALERIAKD